MAKPISNVLKPVGVFFATTSQTTKQAPLTNAADVAPAGVVAGYPYDVFFAIDINNIRWILLQSTTPNKYEWARADMSTGTGEYHYGAYVGPVYGQG